jgi:hypothetical protein
VPSEKLVVDYQVVSAPGTATPSIVISGLSSAVDVSYRLELYVENGRAGSSSVFLRFNGDTGATYGYTRIVEIYPAAPAQGAGINDTALLIGSNAAIYHMLWSQLNITAHINQSGGLRVLVNGLTNQNAWSSGGAGYAGDLLSSVGVYGGSAGDLSSISIVGDQALAIGVGSRIRLWSTGRAGAITVTPS